MKLVQRIRILLGSWILIGILGAVPLMAAEGKSRITNSASGAEEDLFAQPKVHRLKLELPDSSVEALRKEPRHYVKATLREGSQVYADVGVRLKGGTNAPSIDKKPGFSIKFAEFVKDQQFHGRSRILLNHSQSDPTFLAEAIAGEIFRAAEIPAAKVTFAQVELNGRDLGLYVIAEAANRDFLSQYFKKTKGNLYEGVNVDVTEPLEKDSGDNSTAQSDLKALALAAKEPDPAQRLSKLGAVLDVDRFISFAAVEVLVWHQTGYPLGRSNYRIYHDPGSDRLVFMSHDLDRICGQAEGPILPEWQGIVAKAVLSTPEGQRRYLERLAKFEGKAFKSESINARIKELSAVVRPALEHDANAVKAFDAAVPQLRERIAKREAFVQQALQHQGKP